jgi:hypothetical protein
VPTARVKMLIRPVSQAAGATFRETVELELSKYTVMRRLQDWVFDPDSRTIVFEIEFRTRAMMDAFRTWFQDNLAVLSPLANGIVKLCMCSHDDPEVYSCTTDPRSFYREVRL